MTLRDLGECDLCEGNRVRGPVDRGAETWCGLRGLPSQ
jgi:hypothetical protein